MIIALECVGVDRWRDGVRLVGGGDELEVLGDAGSEMTARRPPSLSSGYCVDEWWDEELAEEEEEPEETWEWLMRLFTEEVDEPKFEEGEFWLL